LKLLIKKLNQVLKNQAAGILNTSYDHLTFKIKKSVP
jgi:hypothetical protein